MKLAYVSSLFCKKGLGGLFLVGFVGGLTGDEATMTAFKPRVAKVKNYVADGALEPVVFYTQLQEGAPEKIVRHGTLKLVKDAPATILICHGYMVDKYDIGFFRSMFSNYNVMTFDFRAHGAHADGQYCTFGKEEAFDVMGAVQYLRDRPECKGKPLVAYGFSMGAVSAIEAQSRTKLFDAMILDCPFDSSDNLLKKGLANLTVDVFGYRIPLPGRNLLERYAYTPFVQSLVKVILRTVSKMDAMKINTRIMHIVPSQSVTKIDVPCFFITCKNDEKVSVDAVVSVYAGAQGYKRLWITNGRHHFDSFFYNPEKYSYKVNAFVQKVTSGRLNMQKAARIIEDPLTN